MSQDDVDKSHDSLGELVKEYELGQIIDGNYSETMFNESDELKNTGTLTRQGDVLDFTSGKANLSRRGSRRSSVKRLFTRSSIVNKKE